MGFDLASSILQLPQSRKKRKYVLHLFSSKSVHDGDIRIIERTMSTSLKDFNLIKMEDPDEALKLLLIKNIELVVLDHSFLEDDILCVEFAHEIKQRKKCPVLFVTQNETELIEEYRRQMSLYEELDDYLLSPLDFVETSRRLKKATIADGRASKRFLVEAPVQAFRLNDEKMVQGRLVDLSLVGFGLSVDHSMLFHRGEQVRIHVFLPFFQIFHPEYAEILKLAGIVRRISIDGKHVGCSIEHITPMQNDCLVMVLERLARKLRSAKRVPPKRIAPKKEFSL
jgi:CheY-like chemotaxis protein